MRKWTIEKIKEDAKKYNTKKEWKNNSKSYAVAQWNHIIDECSTHMITYKKPKGYWTEEKIKEESIKYNTKMEWKNNSKASYGAAQRLHIIDKCSEHMIELLKPKRYWSNENIKKEALKYKTRVEWFNKNRSSYSIAIKKKILYECCKHMITTNRGKFIIYAYEFSDRHYYVGLTRRRDERKIEHLTDPRSSVYKYIQKTNTIPTYKVLWGETVYDYIAQQKEKEWDNYYLNNNWIRLNIANTGSIGSPRYKKWTEEKIKEESLKYNTKRDWYTNSPKSYDAAQRYNLINILSKHMKSYKKPKNYWTEEKIKEEALKYKTRMEWKNNSNGSYSKACTLGILNCCCKHMINIKN